MDTQQLKLLAGRVRTLLAEAHHPIGHSEALDLIAALPGLRNWPEVQAFPNRITSCQLDLTTTARLSFRLKKKFQLDMPAQEVLHALSTPTAESSDDLPQIWPTGPAPGVYVTTSREAIQALLQSYEDATDGEVAYVEDAARGWEGGIYLGDDGLWSSGLDRVPSGTLLVIGPLELNQQAWPLSGRRLEMACIRANVSGHRVAVLVDTPTPEALHEDIELLADSIQDDPEYREAALRGIVNDEGELQQVLPFSRPRPILTSMRYPGTADAIPESARALLRDGLSELRTGLVVMSFSQIQENWGIDLIAAALSLTEHAGPAARVMPRRRSTPAKDWMVPEAIKQLPFLPSIESAYEQGYRRLIVDAGYTRTETMLEYGRKAMLISGACGGEVDDACMSLLRSSGSRNEEELLEQIVAILGVMSIPTKAGTITACDLYLRTAHKGAAPKGYSEFIKYLIKNRTLKWEVEARRFLDSEAMTVAELKAAMPRNMRLPASLTAKLRSKTEKIAATQA